MRYYLCLVVFFCLVGGTVGTAGAQNQELPLGSPMPSGSANAQNAATGSPASLSGLKGGRGTIVIFWSNQCAWVDKYEDRVLGLVQEYGGNGVSFVFINSNDPAAFPKENLDESQARARGRYPNYLMDTGGQLAAAFGASRTPHVFAFDADGVLSYAGTIDDSPGDPGSVQNEYLRDVVTALSSGGAVDVPKTKAFGCTIKS